MSLFVLTFFSFLCVTVSGYTPVMQKPKWKTATFAGIEEKEWNVVNKAGLGSVCGKMFLCSAPLGMLLDNYHGLFNVLNYESGYPFTLAWEGTPILKSACWVPILFGCAGSVMGFLIVLFDHVHSQRTGVAATKYVQSYPKILYSISLFAFQYYLSGLLDFSGVDNLTENLVLGMSGFAGYVFFDKTLPVFLLSVATLIAGPVAEIILINAGHLYSYTHADFHGICSWIPWVYFLGATPVGNLARRFYSDAISMREVGQ